MPRHVLLVIIISIVVHPIPAANIEDTTVIFRQCRWSPFTAKNMNGFRRSMHFLTEKRLGADQLSEALFSYDDFDEWEPVVNNKSELQLSYLAPKWIFRNRGSQVLLAAALLVDELVPDSQRSNNPYQQTAWSMLLCAVYKIRKTVDVPSHIIDQLGEDKHVPLLIDYIFQLGQCLQASSVKELCPSICSDIYSLFMPLCSNLKNVKRGRQSEICKPMENVDYKYIPFSGAKLSEISSGVFKAEMDQFRIWYESLPEMNRMPYEMFEENLENDAIVRAAAIETSQIDPDEKEVTIDSEFKSLYDRFRSSGCDKAENREKSKCLMFRAIVHGKLVKLQQYFVGSRECKCRLGFSWEKEIQGCTSQLLGYCAEENPCLNGGLCEATNNEQADAASNGESIKVRCKCPAAWTGNNCELENNVCEQLPSSSTCGVHRCQRSTVFENGYLCLCSPQFYRRKSPDDPHCEDINECEESVNQCLNDGWCENMDPGFICKCREGFAGSRCEITNSSAKWSQWEQWSSCQLPQPAFTCSESPKQERVRTCESNQPSLTCAGPRREVRYICPGASLGSADYIECSVQQTETTWSQSGSHNATISEQYAIHDHMVNEESGQFSSHELGAVLRNDKTEYGMHHAFLTLVLTLCMSAFVYLMWLYKIFLKALITKCAKILFDKSFAT